MSVRIRLRRTGRKKQPSYRIVVADSRSPRDGAYLDNVGTYNPTMQPAELRIDLAKVDTWVAKGADMTVTVASLVRKARRGGDAKVTLRPIAGAASPAGETPAPDADTGSPAGAADAGAPTAAAAGSAPAADSGAPPRSAEDAGTPADAAEPTEA